MSIVEKIYSRIITRDDAVADDLAPQEREHVARNGLRQVLANTLQSSGDQTIRASTVLPWLFHALGVPAALTGLLVPIREAGSMLPQALLTPLILRAPQRKWVFVAGALIQAVSVAVMATAAALGSGLSAGITVLGALVVFSLGRSLGSITSKDVQGRTIPKGERGQINGIATTASGFVVITLGLAIRYFGGTDLTGPQIAWLISAGAILWVGVAVVYAGIREPRDAAPRTMSAGAGWFSEMLKLLKDDKPFRRFVTVRSLLLVSALSPPFIVTLAAQSGHDTIAGLGGYIIASGIAALIGGRIFGRLADRSSRRLMAVGAAISSATLILLVGVRGAIDFSEGSVWEAALYIMTYFVLTLIHTGVRVGRKTYVVDMAEGDLRTTYVAVSNSAMGVILLGIGALSSALALVGISWALLLLATLGVLGSIISIRLPEVSAK